MWYKRGEEQLAKCCEANGLRMVAPEECGGIYIEAELQAENEQTAPISVQTTAGAPVQPVVIPQPTVAPAVNQAPAEQPTAETAPVVAHSAPVVADSKPEVAHTAAPARPAAPPRPAARPAAPKPAPQATVAASSPVPAQAPAPAVKPADVPATPSPAPNIHGVVVTDDDLPENLRGQSTNETPKELAEFADRVARDNSPVGGTAAAHAVLAPANPTPATAQPASTAPVADSPKPQPTAAPCAATAQTGEQPATQAEYQTFMGRASKVVRDKLEKEAKLKNAGNFMKDYLTKKSGKKLNHISAATFELLISELEKASPEQAAQIVKG
jgi:hypothetical protein